MIHSPGIILPWQWHLFSRAELVPRSGAESLVPVISGLWPGCLELVVFATHAVGESLERVTLLLDLGSSLCQPVHRSGSTWRWLKCEPVAGAGSHAKWRTPLWNDSESVAFGVGVLCGAAPLEGELPQAKGGEAQLQLPPAMQQCLCARLQAPQTWLILPAVICLSQRLSHACLSLSLNMTTL